MLHARFLPVLIAMVVASGFNTTLWGEDIRFPDDAGVVNMSQPPYSLVGDGKTDNTVAFQKAFDDLRGKNLTFYFPNGTYLVSDRVGITGGKAHSNDRFINLQGQSEAGAIIKLKDRSPGFDDAANPRVVVSLYDGASTGDAMHTYVRNLTVDVGAGNPGAAGLRYLSNNSGAIYDLTVRSSDPQKLGAIGLDLRQSQNGPAFIKRVTVEGFDYGIQTANTFSLVFEHLSLQNQRKAAFNAGNSRLTIRGLKTSSTAAAAFLGDKHTNITLIEAELRTKPGGAPTAIVLKGGKAFFRDIKASGYAHTIEAPGGDFVDGPVDEWYPGKAQNLFGVAKATTLRLPIEETPEIPWETDMNKWVPVGVTGAQGGLTFQQAIDKAAREKKTTVYFPKARGSAGKYVLDQPVRVHGSVNRIIGMENILWIDGEGVKEGQVAITFENLDGPVVIERFFNILKLGGWKGLYDRYLFENKSTHPVVIRSLAHGSCMHKKPGTGGKWFIEDLAGGRMAQFGKGEKTWMRQYNPESPDLDMCLVDGGQAWILGLKTEGRSRHIVATNGAKVELLGGVAYQSWKNQPIDPPMFTVVDSDASFTIGFYHWNLPFTNIVSETRGGQTKLLERTALKDYHLPLYRADAGK